MSESKKRPRREGALLPWLAWTFVYLAMCAWALAAYAKAEDFGFLPELKALFAARVALVIVAAVASLLVVAGRRLPGWSFSVYALVALGLQALWLGVQVDIHPIDMHLLGLMFFASVVFYRGSEVAFALILAPIGAAILFAPIVQWERTGFVSREGLEHFALISIAYFASGCALATIFGLFRRVRESSSALTASLGAARKLAIDLRAIGVRMKSAIGGAVDGASRVQLRTEEVVSPLAAVEDVEVIGSEEAHRLMRELLDRASAAQGMERRIRFLFTAPREFDTSFSVRGNAQLFKVVVGGLIERAVSNISPNEGIVRVTLAPNGTFNATSLSLSIEDNGRGLHHDRLTGPQSMGFEEIREIAETVGWRLTLQSRLGVGTRSTLTLPRFERPTPSARLNALERPRPDASI